MAATETSTPTQDLGDARAKRFYAHALALLAQAGVPFLVGGAYALHRYTGIARFTKDFDLFALPGDRDRILDLLRGAGYAVEVTFPHWLAKVYHEDAFIDVIYSSGNGAPASSARACTRSTSQFPGSTSRACSSTRGTWSSTRHST